MMTTHFYFSDEILPHYVGQKKLTATMWLRFASPKFSTRTSHSCKVSFNFFRAMSGRGKHLKDGIHSSKAMTYAVAEHWRSLQPEDDLDIDSLKPTEGLIKKLLDGPNLAYVRHHESYCNREITWFMRTSEGSQLGYFAQMIMRGLAPHAVPSIQIMIRCPAILDTPGYLSEVAEQLHDIYPHLEDIPTSNPNYLAEIAVLKKICDASERLREGRMTDNDWKLFWGFGTPWGAQSKLSAIIVETK